MAIKVARQIQAKQALVGKLGERLVDAVKALAEAESASVDVAPALAVVAAALANAEAAADLA